MFSTVLNIFSWTLWTIKNSFLLFLLLCRLSWKLLLVLVFLDGFYKAIRFLHKVCNIIAEKSSQEKKKTSDLNVLLHQSSEDISVVSEMSSFNTNEEYVVESWNSYQVKLGVEHRARTSSWWFSEYFRRGWRWGGGRLHRCLQDWLMAVRVAGSSYCVPVSVSCVSLNIDIPVTSNTFFPSTRPSVRRSSEPRTLTVIIITSKYFYFIWRNIFNEWTGRLGWVHNYESIQVYDDSDAKFIPCWFHNQQFYFIWNVLQPENQKCLAKKWFCQPAEHWPSTTV